MWRISVWLGLLGSIASATPLPGAEPQVVAVFQVAPLAVWRKIDRQLKLTRLLPPQARRPQGSPLPRPWQQLLGALRPEEPLRLLLVTDGVLLEPLVLLPCPKPEPVLQALDALGIESQPVEAEKLWRLNPGPWSGFALWRPGHLVLAQRQGAFRLLPEKVPQADAGMGNPLVALAVFPQRVPPAYREMVLDHLRGFPRPRAESDSSSPERSAAWEFVLWDLLLRQTQAVGAQVQFGGTPPQLVFRAWLEPLPQSPLARAIRHQAQVRPRLAPAAESPFWSYAAWRPVPAGKGEPPPWLLRLQDSLPPAAGAEPMEGLVQLLPRQKHHRAEFVLRGVQSRWVRSSLQAALKLLSAAKTTVPRQADLFAKPQVRLPWPAQRHSRAERLLGSPLELQVNFSPARIVGFLGPPGHKPAGGEKSRQALPPGTLAACRLQLGVLLEHEAEARRGTAAAYTLALLGGLLRQGKDDVALRLRARQERLSLQLELGLRVVQAAALVVPVLWKD